MASTDAAPATTITTDRASQKNALLHQQGRTDISLASRDDTPERELSALVEGSAGNEGYVA
ncbi:hypothetical protein Slin14017_G128560 [Septoria linicola]|nr:hypothetical protein Slin14017_G128560 [Septoria linicola]